MIKLMCPKNNQMFSKKIRPFFTCLLCGCCISLTLAAQETKRLTAEELTNIVKKYHPVAQQAAIGVEKAKADVLSARGGFDPSLYQSTEQKTFDGKNYFIYTETALKIPTWYGIEVKAGLENNAGALLNSESTFGRTSYIGVSVPLAKNLLMDKRRAVLQQSKLMRSLSVAEQRNTLNDLLFNAQEAYWNWVKEFRLYEILSEAVAINETRFNLIKIGYRQGDRAAIDTIEALAQWQQFQLLQQETFVRFQNAGVELSFFLWTDNNQPYSLPENTLPDPGWNVENIPAAGITALDAILTRALATHPKLQMFTYKLSALEVERKLKFQSLLPTFNVKTNLLNRGYQPLKGLDAALLQNNYKFGFDLGMPLRLSEGRGEYHKAKLKIRETGLEQDLQQTAILNKVKMYYNELLGLRKQVEIYEAAYNNYQRLFRGEDIRFKAGESTLFLLNTRENKALEALQKLTELKTKFFKTKVALSWAAGELN
jgi:outer membrane protein TolC